MKLLLRSKRKFALVILMVFLVSVAMPVGAAPFKDMGDHWADKDVNKMYAKGIVAGYGDEYRPNESIIREQAIVMLIRAMGLVGETGGLTIPATFLNSQLVSPDFRPTIALAVNKGIISGGDLIDFRPKDPIKRFEVAVFIAKAMGFSGSAVISGSLPFTDAKGIDAWAVPYVSYVYKEGIMSGDAGGSFRPNGEVTRAEMATMLARIDDKLKKLTGNTVKGEIFSGPSNNSLLLTEGSGQVVNIIIATNADVFKEGKRVSLTSLQKGDKLEIIKNNQGQATYLEVIPADKFTYDQKTVTGTIERIMLGNPTVLTVNTSLGSANYSLTQSTKIKVDGLQAQVSNILVGQKVTLTIEGNNVVEIEGENLEREVKGQLGAISLGFFPSLEIIDEQGNKTNYTLTAKARVELDGRIIEGQDLVAGQQVRAMVIGTEITRLWASSFADELKGSFVRAAFSPRETVIIKVEVAKGVWEDKAFEVAKDASIRRDRRAASLRDLMPGDSVEIELKNNQVVSLYAEKLEMETEGRVTAITLARNPLLTIVDNKGQEWTFDLALDARLRKDREVITITDLRVDDYVSVRVEGQSIVSLYAENRIVKDHLIGSVVEVNRDAQIIGVEETDNNTRGIGVYTDRYTRIIKFGNDIRLQDLSVGDRIFVLGKSESYRFVAETIVVISAAE